MLDDLTSSIVSVQEHVKRPQPALSHLPVRLDGSLTMAVMYLTQARLGATQDVEAMIHALAEALPKIDDRTCMVTQLSEVGPIGLYTITRWGNDEAELDGQLSPLEILNQVHGAEIGLEIWQRGMSGLQSAERWTLAYRADLSHPRPADSGSGVEILSP